MNLNEIKTSRYNLGKSEMCSGNKYRIRMSYNGVTVSFNYHDNYKNESGVKDYLYALLSDKNAYESTRDVNDFMLGFGYKNYNEAKRIREACKRNSEKLEKLFNSEELEEIEKELENY